MRSRFVKNVNEYLDEKKIRLTFLSMRTRIEINQLKCILNGTQDISSKDMRKIAENLGKTVEYFVNEDFCVPQEESFENKRETWNSNLNEEQKKLLRNLIELLENVSEVLDAEERYILGGKTLDSYSLF